MYLKVKQFGTWFTKQGQQLSREASASWKRGLGAVVFVESIFFWTRKTAEWLAAVTKSSAESLELIKPNAFSLRLAEQRMYMPWYFVKSRVVSL